MIGKITAPRGERVEPLIWYLYGPGRDERAHRPAHRGRLAAPRRAGTAAAPGRQPGLPHAERAAEPAARRLGRRGYARPVWHCSVRAAPEDRMLSDDEWAQIAHDVMDRTGLSRYGEDDDARPLGRGPARR